MKKFTKILISFCMLFVVTFTLTACKDKEPENKFNPPAGVDMTSAESYAGWLDNNLDETLSYTLTSSTTQDGATATYTIKYQYKHGIQYVAIYDGLDMVSYMEIFKDGRDYEVSIYDVDSEKYFTDTLTTDEFYGSSSSMFGESLVSGDTTPIALNKMRHILSQRRFFAHLTANTYLTFMETSFESVSNSTKTISNPSDGKYELKETATTDGAITDTVFTYENNIIQSLNISTADGDNAATMACTYKYGFVSFTFDKTGYTLLTNS